MFGVILKWFFIILGIYGVLVFIWSMINPEKARYWNNYRNSTDNGGKASNSVPPPQDSTTGYNYNCERSWLRTRTGEVLGRIEHDQYSGRSSVYDKYGALKGWYDRNTNTTHDNIGRVVGFGDQLNSLVV